MENVKYIVWNLIWCSVRYSVSNFVGNSVWDSIWKSVPNPVKGSVGNSVWGSIWNSNPIEESFDL